MRRFLVLLAILTVFASACGSDTSTTDAGADPDSDQVDDATADTDDQTSDDQTSDDQDIDLDEPLGAGPYPIADLGIAVQPDGTIDGVIVYRLACLGDTATLTGDSAPNSAEAMCLALNDDAVRTRLIAGVPGDRLCTEIYGGPQLAEISGTLDDDSVDTTVDRANGCGIDDWDRLLSVLLPSA